MAGKQAMLQKQNIRSSTNKVVITTGGYKNLLQQRQGFKTDHNNFVKQRHDCRFLGQRKEPFLIKVTSRAYSCITVLEKELSTGMTATGLGVKVFISIIQDRMSSKSQLKESR